MCGKTFPAKRPLSAKLIGLFALITAMVVLPSGVGIAQEKQSDQTAKEKPAAQTEAAKSAKQSKPAPANARKTAVSVDAVQRQEVSQTFPIIGRLVAVQYGPIASRISGPVKEIMVEVGARVTKGDAVALLDDERLKWEVEEKAAVVKVREAEVATVQNELNMARQDLKRQEQLKKNKSNAFQQARYDDQRVQVAMNRSETVEAGGRLAQARAELQLAEVDLSNAVVRAPYDGVVTAKRTEAGAYVQSGEAIVELVNDANMEVEADIPSDRIDGVGAGRQVSVQLGTETLPVTVRAVIPEENPRTRTRAVRFAFAEAVDTTVMAVNQSLTVQVPLGRQRAALTVHKDAVLDRRNQKIVFVVRDEKATPVPVTLGDAIADRFEVMAGLAEGDLVVIRGNERLRPQETVTY